MNAKSRKWKNFMEIKSTGSWQSFSTPMKLKLNTSEKSCLVILLRIPSVKTYILESKSIHAEFISTSLRLIVNKKEISKFKYQNYKSHKTDKILHFREEFSSHASVTVPAGENSIEVEFKIKSENHQANWNGLRQLTVMSFPI